MVWSRCAKGRRKVHGGSTSKVKRGRLAKRREWQGERERERRREDDNKKKKKRKRRGERMENLKESEVKEGRRGKSEVKEEKRTRLGWSCGPLGWLSSVVCRFIYEFSFFSLDWNNIMD